jgi:hypothetical protein
MTHSIQEITAKISALPEPMQQEAFAFVELLHLKAAHQALLSQSEPAPAIEWHHPGENEAWVTY